MGAERLPAPKHFPLVTTQAHCGNPGQGGVVSVGPIWHTCITIHPAKHRILMLIRSLEFTVKLTFVFMTHFHTYTLSQIYTRCIENKVCSLRCGGVIFAGNSISIFFTAYIDIIDLYRYYRYNIDIFKIIKSSLNFDHIYYWNSRFLHSKVGSLTMQPAKHDVTVMPLYQMYPYPIRSSTLWLAYPCSAC